ncbi:ImmA/IrrE family metallo-endopeptidase [uncultured Metabacillus sp.]|uniref:ImmA/IrrE family metallo-endopeptidase n=1 Tax=uncultured Metabacillus sp. TaxID=2860135 RepID=UPI00260AFA68|nr:ImmA/IrrE family metallo-endopeptidase [uncultured Metabacillus sp.]
MSKVYPTTALEDWVTSFYLKLKIKKPSEISEDYIAKRNEIFIKRDKIPSRYDVVGRFRAITIDIRKDKLKQREIFFHELCHILRHSGRQGMIPEAFRQLQEWDARNFVRYAAIPNHMLHYIDLNDSSVIDNMVHLFKVTPELCTERLIQIEKRKYLKKQMSISI